MEIRVIEIGYFGVGSSFQKPGVKSQLLGSSFLNFRNVVIARFRFALQSCSGRRQLLHTTVNFSPSAPFNRARKRLRLSHLSPRRGEGTSTRCRIFPGFEIVGLVGTFPGVLLCTCDCRMPRQTWCVCWFLRWECPPPITVSVSRTNLNFEQNF